jgi:HAMP domain-containing protein
MTKPDHLKDHLEDLFSDVSFPEPQVREEAVTPEPPSPDEPALAAVKDKVESSLREAFESEIPPPKPAAEPAAVAIETLELPAPDPLISQPPSVDQVAPGTLTRVARRISEYWRIKLRHTLVLAFLVTAMTPTIIIAAFGGIPIVALLSVAVTFLLGNLIAQRIIQPIIQITESARRVVAGDLNQAVAINREDEIGTLAQAFNHMVSQLRTTVAGLEEEVAERTNMLQEANYRFQKRAIQLEVSAEVSRAAASILDPQELMQTTVDLIRTRFGFYHVSFFLLDETGEWAVVRASTGAVGRQMVAQPHRLAVGGESMVGWVCAQRQPRIALDVGEDAVPLALHASARDFDDPLLPDTRSEMALPLRIGNRLLGALNVQSTEEAAFDDDDVRTLQGMADLVAIALENAHLFTETRRGVLYQQLVTRVTDRMQRATSIADILTLTLEDLGETFDLAQAAVCLGTEAELLQQTQDPALTDGDGRKAE